MTNIVTPSAGLYLCSRTSAHYPQPCEEAYQVLVTQVDRRSYDDPKKIPANRGTEGDWYTKGTNHRVENGQICRDRCLREEWAVYLPDLAALQAFVDKHGRCILDRDDNGFCTIEIYDTYRE